MSCYSCARAKISNFKQYNEMPDKPDITVVCGKEIRSHLKALARLRITVFREFPYLYEGNDAYERSYLETYTKSDESVFVLATVNNKIVGAASGMPLAFETDEVIKPFPEQSYDIGDVFYFGESVLLPAYRGMGIGKSFILEREKHALSLGYTVTAFCAVVRNPDHPEKPEGYTPLDGFWTKMGYSRRPEMKTTFEWQDIDELKPSSKQMVFWVKKH